MTTEVENKAIEKNIQNLEPYLSRMSKKELAQILEYGEKIKAEGERKKKEFWEKYNRADCRNLLNYLSEHQEEIESQYRYLDKMEKEDKERFINDYLHEDMLYSCPLKTDGEKIFTKNYSYQDWKEGKVKMEECINLEFAGNDIGNGLTIAISEIKLKEGVKLNLSSNRIGDRGIKAIAQDLELKEGVELDLRFNEIGDEGAQALIDNMELKRGTILNLRGNNISEDMKLKLKEWEIFYRDRGILCQVLS